MSQGTAARRIDIGYGSYNGSDFIAPSGVIMANGYPHAAVREPALVGTFHLSYIKEYSPGNFWFVDTEHAGIIHQPIHPSMAPEDIEGATYAHDTGTHWMFAHCSPAEQLDFAAQAEHFCYAAFQEQIHRALNSGQTGANTKARALMDFAMQASRDVFNTVRRATLGAYHRNPHHDHKRELAVASMNKVWKAWQSNSGRVADRNAIETIFGQVRMRLATNYIIEWRHERAPAWAAAGRDPVSGREWCYTLVATKTAITGEANLPDPAWHFDAFPVGGAMRGTQRYTDGEPTPTDAEPWVVRFHRPAPRGTAPGVSIGSVAWTQEEPYDPNA